MAAPKVTIEGGTGAETVASNPFYIPALDDFVATPIPVYNPPVDTKASAPAVQAPALANPVMPVAPITVTPQPVPPALAVGALVVGQWAIEDASKNGLLHPVLGDLPKSVVQSGATQAGWSDAASGGSTLITPGGWSDSATGGAAVVADPQAGWSDAASGGAGLVTTPVIPAAPVITPVTVPVTVPVTAPAVVPVEAPNPKESPWYLPGLDDWVYTPPVVYGDPVSVPIVTPAQPVPVQIPATPLPVAPVTPPPPSPPGRTTSPVNPLIPTDPGGVMFPVSPPGENPAPGQSNPDPDTKPNPDPDPPGRRKPRWWLPDFPWWILLLLALLIKYGMDRRE